MMAEQERYPPPNFSWTAQQPQTVGFDAARDWSWTQPAPTGPWNTNPGAVYSHGHRPYYEQQYTGPHHHYPQHAQRQGWQDHRQQWGKKRQKDPEFSYFCDTCDRGFKNQDKYDEHVSQHVKCSVEDCKFTAHEKLVKIHWRNNHAPGTKRIKLDTPEEIARWREERRKNYPTLSNMQKKVKIMEVKQQRGDVLETAQFGRIRNRGRGRGSGRGFNRWSRGAHERSEPLSSEVKQPTSLQQTHQDGDPLGALANSDAGSDKEDSTQQKQPGLSVAPRNVTSALGSLMASYGGDMTASESEGDTDDSPVLRATQALEKNKVLLEAHPVPFQSNTNAPPQSHHAPAGRGRGASGNQRGRGHGGGHRNCTKRTLLEMLLAPDIRHERNVILQCVRYIVRKEFFGLAGRHRNDITTVTTKNLMFEEADGSSSTDENVVRNVGEHLVVTSESQEELNNAARSMDHTGLVQRSPEISQTSETSCETGVCDVTDVSVRCNETGVISAHSPDKAKQPSIFLQLFAQSLVCEDSAPDSPQTKDAPDASQEPQDSFTKAVDEAEDSQTCHEGSTNNTVDQ